MFEEASSNTARRSAAAALAYLPPHGLRHPPEVAAVGVHDGEVSWPEPVIILSDLIVDCLVLWVVFILCSHSLVSFSPARADLPASPAKLM